MLKHAKLGLLIPMLFPQANFIEDFIVEDGPDGPQLTFWNEERLGPVPNVDQLNAAAQALDRDNPRKQFLEGVSLSRFMEAIFESQIGNPEPLQALAESYRQTRE